MNVGLDLRLVDTNTLEVVDVISYQKQIIGRQVQVGVFDFLGHNFFDASVGESALEPIQLAVRSVLERAVLEMVSRLYRAPSDTCTAGLGGEGDPLAGPDDRSPYAPTHAAIASTTTTTEEKHNDPSHEDPYRFYSSGDPADEPRLRGGVN
jgi:hypothetical protein